MKENVEIEELNLEIPLIIDINSNKQTEVKSRQSKHLKMGLGGKMERVLEILCNSDTSIQTYEYLYYDNSRYNHCFIGSDVIDWVFEHCHQLFEEYNKPKKRRTNPSLENSNENITDPSTPTMRESQEKRHLMNDLLDDLDELEQQLNNSLPTDDQDDKGEDEIEQYLKQQNSSIKDNRNNNNTSNSTVNKKTNISTNTHSPQNFIEVDEEEDDEDEIEQFLKKTKNSNIISQNKNTQSEENSSDRISSPSSLNPSNKRSLKGKQSEIHKNKIPLQNNLQQPKSNSKQMDDDEEEEEDEIDRYLRETKEEKYKKKNKKNNLNSNSNGGYNTNVDLNYNINQKNHHMKINKNETDDRSLPKNNFIHSSAFFSFNRVKKKRLIDRIIQKYTNLTEIFDRPLNIHTYQEIQKKVI